jgi:hypothetical protein
MRKRPTESFLIDILVVLCKLRRYVGTFEIYQEQQELQKDHYVGCLQQFVV